MDAELWDEMSRGGPVWPPAFARGQATTSGLLYSWRKHGRRAAVAFALAVVALPPRRRAMTQQEKIRLTTLVTAGG